MDLGTPILADRNAMVDIDHLNISSSRYFAITKDRGASELFRVSESGSCVFTGALSGITTLDMSGNLTAGGATGSARIHSIATTEQLRLGYDLTKYASFIVDTNTRLEILLNGSLYFDTRKDRRSLYWGLNAGGYGASLGLGELSIGIGDYALDNACGGNYNVAIGAYALTECGGAFNTVVGSMAGAALLGSSNTLVGSYAGGSLAAADGSVFIGFKSGYYETGGSKLFIDNTPRADEADGRVKALIYGVFAAATADQYLSLNANVTVSNNLTCGGVGCFQYALNADTLFNIESYNDSGYQSHLLLKQSQSNTKGTLLASIDNIGLGSIDWYGVRSGAPAAWGYGARIRGHTTGGAGPTYIPTKLIFETCTNSAVNTDQFILNSDNTFSFAGAGTITGTLTNSALTASTLIYSNASKIITSLANSGAVSYLRNDGAGALSWVTTATATAHALDDTAFHTGGSLTSTYFPYYLTDKLVNSVMTQSSSNIGIGIAVPTDIIHAYRSVSGACQMLAENPNAGVLAAASFNALCDATHYFTMAQFGANRPMSVGGLTTAGMSLLIARGAGTMICNYDNVSMYFATNNVTRLTIDGAGIISHRIAGAAYTQHYIENYSTTGYFPVLALRQSQSDVLGTLVASVTDKELGYIQWHGVNSGNNWYYGAWIKGYTTGAAGVTYVPTKLIFETCSSTAVNANQFILNSDGTFSFAGAGTVTGALTNSALTATGIVYAGTAGVLSTASAVSKFNYDATNVGVGIGATALTNARLYTSQSTTNDPFSMGYYLQKTTTSTIAGSYPSIGIYFDILAGGTTNNTSYVEACKMSSYAVNSSGKISYLYGFEIACGQYTGGGNVGYAIGLNFSMIRNSGVTDALYAVCINQATGAGTATVERAIISTWDALSTFVGGISILSDANYFKWGAGQDCGIMYDGTDMNFYANLVGTGVFKFKDASIFLETIKSGATQVAAGAAANEVWKTASHATLPDNVLLIGV